MIAVDRAGDVRLTPNLNDSEAAIAEKRNLLIFPEGTRQPPSVIRSLRVCIFALSTSWPTCCACGLEFRVLWPKDAGIIRQVR